MKTQIIKQDPGSFILCLSGVSADFQCGLTRDEARRMRDELDAALDSQKPAQVEVGDAEENRNGCSPGVTTGHDPHTAGGSAKDTARGTATPAEVPASASPSSPASGPSPEHVATCNADRSLPRGCAGCSCYRHGPSPEACGTCGGEGRRWVPCDPFGNFHWKECRDCNGTGRTQTGGER